MLVCSSTLLREVLLIWMSYSLGEQALELRAVEAGGAAEQRHARRIEEELVLAQRAATASAQRGARRDVVVEARTARNSAGIISSASSTRKYFEISGCSLIARADLERELDRAA